MAKKKSAFDALGGALGHSGRRRRKSRGLIAASGFGRRGRKRSGGLSKFLALGDRVTGRRSGRHGGLAAQAFRSLQDRMSPTEEAQIKNAADRAMEDDKDLRAMKNDSDLTQNENFVQRLIRLARERMARG